MVTLSVRVPRWSNHPKGDAHVPSCGAVRRRRRLPGSGVRRPTRGRGRDLQLAVHRQAHQGPGGLRLRLDPGRRGPGRRLRQAGDGRRQPEVEDLRQGARLGLGRHARRGPPHGLHRRPPLHLGRRARREQDLRLRHRDRSGQAQAREDHHRPGRQDRLPRPAHVLRAAGPHAGAGALQHEGQGRRHRHGGLQQQGRLHRHLRRCRPTTAATATATTWRSTRRRTCCSPRASPATRTTCGRSASSSRTRRR